jgi:hypothetical protein
MALSYDVNRRDYTFRRSGAYTNAAPRPFNPLHARPAPRRNAGWGATCPGWSLTRSRANACECNQG